MNSAGNSTLQTVPDLISPGDPNDFPDKVTYLPSINKSPIEMATVNEIFHLVKAKADALQLREVDLVPDHAIYCKALEIISNLVNSSLKNANNLRMGEFHVRCILRPLYQKDFLIKILKT